MDGYIGFTCSAVTDKFEKFVVFLGIRKMHGRHTSQAILAESEQLWQDWKIPSNKVSRIMTDGGSNMVAAGFDQIPGWESG
uniref:DUF659 domain-containing protein n=1 Tax=Daphnia galeata TaxID=27404 RepID=A0A8J2WCT6_9CRUS|nr:unnamed protein product [Daphnia galeata]